MKKYRYWLINASVQLFSKTEPRRRLLSIFPNSKIAIRKAGRHKTQNLMPDAEYFVPIPVKCLGYDIINPPSNLDKDAEKLLKNIKNQYVDIYKMQNPQFFWKEKKSIRMLTEEGKGYYKIIEEQSDKDTVNILIGYSQGGLVARFLAFADKMIYKKGLINGVISISTPHYGSPVADPDNREKITDNLIAIIYSLVTLTPSRIPNTINYLKDKIDFEDVQTFLAKLMADSRNNKDIKAIGRLAGSLNRWLSGLEDNPDTAFFDLSPARFADQYSTLSLCNNTALEIPMTSIISKNNSMEELIFSLLETKNPFIRFLYPIYTYMLRHTRIMGMKLQSGIERAGIGYRELFIPATPPVTEKQGLAEKRYRMGIPDYKIDAEAHDFIIPSAYQMIETGSAKITEIRVNPYANHDSGKDAFSKAGKLNISHVCQAIIENRSFYT